jgi:hypothetical protein
LQTCNGSTTGAWTAASTIILTLVNCHTNFTQHLQTCNGSTTGAWTAASKTTWTLPLNTTPIRSPRRCLHALNPKLKLLNPEKRHGLCLYTCARAHTHPRARAHTHTHTRARTHTHTNTQVKRQDIYANERERELKLAKAKERARVKAQAQTLKSPLYGGP